MATLLLAAITAITAVTALIIPWTGIIAYYLLALLGPQYIWFWAFDGLRTSFVIAVFTFVGLGLRAVSGGVNYRFLRSRQNAYLLLLFGFLLASYYCGAYVTSNDGAHYDPQEMIIRTSKILLYYYGATLVIDEVKKVRYFFYVLVATTAYLVYWANAQYFTENWSQFNAGRLMGPHVQGSIYNDENAFAMLFVTGLPFLYYAGMLCSRKWLRFALWSLIPLGVHAVFLTGSRGGLVGLVATLLVVLLQSRKKVLMLLVLPLFLVFFCWQGGNTMKSRSSTIASYEGEASAESRLGAWSAGMKMIADHPVTGVGIGSFMTALPSYSDIEPVIAHNTLIQYTSESGLGAGFCYLMIIVLFARNSWKRKRWCGEQQTGSEGGTLRIISNSASASFAGLVTCSLFLALNYYEIYYYLLVLGNSLSALCTCENGLEV